MNNCVLSEKELAVELGLSPWTVRNFRLKLGLPHFRTARRIFYRLDAVKAWMTEQEQASNKIVEHESQEYGKLRRVR